MMATLKREKNGATHYAAVVEPNGSVSRWCDADGADVTAEQWAAVKAYHAGKRNCGSLFWGGERLDTPTDGPPPPSAWDELRSMLELPKNATAVDIAVAACAELKAYHGAKEGPSPFVKVEESKAIKELEAAFIERQTVLQDRIVTLTSELADAKLAAPRLPESIDVEVNDEALDVLMAGNSTTTFVPFGSGNLTVSLTRPSPTPTDDAE